MLNRSKKKYKSFESKRRKKREKKVSRAKKRQNKCAWVREKQESDGIDKKKNNDNCYSNE